MKNFKKSACAAALLSALFVAAHSARAGTWWGEQQTFDDIPYNLAIQFSVHNTYDKKEVDGIGQNDGFYKFLEQKIASLEIDLIAEKVNGITQFHVGHGWGDLEKGTICQENMSDNKTPLANCLADVKRWIDDENPDYPITLFLDLKNSSDYDSETYESLEKVFSQSLGGTQLFTPKDLTVAQEQVYSSPRERVEKVGWPSMAQMAGKVIVFIATHNDKLFLYAQGGITKTGGRIPNFLLFLPPVKKALRTLIAQVAILIDSLTKWSRSTKNISLARPKPWALGRSLVVLCCVIGTLTRTVKIKTKTSLTMIFKVL
ncbi:phosphatidylinositol-specific phospholipase C domain-containing protein [Pseudoalteromonas viridis]|uniref:Uncharacterized protein n=1 Tax=Pseudoalteromonas viridis TaxID=339617 RepID=A0ABX7V5P3_9GAMM|nr:phosphatidylinositol-specific phospholipase C domain-containing protein [Pseudoalteromonas viridis]QTL34747.1 hypothetical protein J5X90_14565 [Pseudoalteromonas viridis]